MERAWGSGLMTWQQTQHSWTMVTTCGHCWCDLHRPSQGMRAGAGQHLSQRRCQPTCHLASAGQDL
ncbi:hypothetical protein HaLaN_29409, partial [Haematococcus lacustris]